MSHPISSSASLKSILKQTQPLPQGNLSTPGGRLHTLFSISSHHPRARLILDITVIALSVIAIVSILIAAQGHGLLLLSLIPGVILGVLGLTLLIAHVTEIPKLKKVADTITALLLPVITIGIASALLASAYFTSGGGWLMVATPSFSMAVITVTLALVTLSKVTYQHFCTQAFIKQLKKTQAVSTQTLTPSDTPTPQERKRVTFADERNLTEEAKKVAREREEKRATRQEYVLRHVQAKIQRAIEQREKAKQENLETLSSPSHEPTPEGSQPTSHEGRHSPSPQQEPTPLTPPSPSTPEHVPLGAYVPAATTPSPAEKPSGLPKVEESHALTRDKHRDKDRSSSSESDGDDESSDKEQRSRKKLPFRKGRKKQKR